MVISAVMVNRSYHVVVIQVLGIFWFRIKLLLSIFTSGYIFFFYSIHNFPWIPTSVYPLVNNVEFTNELNFSRACSNWIVCISQDYEQCVGDDNWMTTAQSVLNSQRCKKSHLENRFFSLWCFIVKERFSWLEFRYMRKLERHVWSDCWIRRRSSIYRPYYTMESPCGSLAVYRQTSSHQLIDKLANDGEKHASIGHPCNKK